MKELKEMEEVMGPIGVSLEVMELEFLGLLMGMTAAKTTGMIEGEVLSPMPNLERRAWQLQPRALR